MLRNGRIVFFIKTVYDLEIYSWQLLLFLQIAVQLSVLIAKIARLDCPHNWPDLFPTLLEGIKSSDTLLRQRALHILYHVVKTLATKRLAADRNIFAEVSSINIMVFLFEKLT